jgi:hypothetical protein
VPNNSIINMAYERRNVADAGYSWSMIFSDLPSPAEASSDTADCAKGFAQAGNRYPLFGIMLRKG